MIYVALLRGINVGGKNKVDMKQLKTVFEACGMEQVKTYINSGNVIFMSTQKAPDIMIKLEKAIEKTFGFHVKVLIVSQQQLAKIVSTMNDSWTNDATMKCDVMFLWENVAKPAVLKQLVIKPEIDTVLYESGAIIWCVDRKLVTRSGMMKLVGTDLYKHMTIRNSNTTRKLNALVEQIDG